MAAEEFEDSIPVSIAEALFDFGTGGRFAAWSGIMDGFPPVRIPDSFEVVGSAEYNQNLRVALSTELNEEQARSSLMDTLLDDGWIEMPSFAPPSRDYGFVSASLPVTTRYNAMCHDDYGQLSITFRERSPLNFLTLNVSNAYNPTWRSCAEQIAQQEQSMAMLNRRGQGIFDYMPRLEIPEQGNRSRRPFIGGGMRSSGNSAETEASIQLDWELEEVFQHFAEQISGQGWTSDTESIGSVTATGTWTRSTGQGANIIARLNVVNSEEQRFDLSLSIEAPGGRGGAFILSN